MTKTIKHYGIPRRSGRYPWGSGDDGYQRNKSFLSYVSELKKQGLSEVEIATGLGMSTLQLRQKRSLAKAETRAADVAEATRLWEKGYSKTAIGERMGVNESTVRSWLDPAIKERANQTVETALVLKDAVDKKKYVDVGLGVEQYLGVSRTKLNTAVSLLEEDGYTVHYVKVEQQGTGKFTSIKVLAGPDVPYSEVYKNRYDIQLADGYSTDGGKTFKSGFKTPRSVDSNRILIKYREDGGSEKDGVIEIRRGVEDISLGGARYAQVRIAVDGNRYMKGMAMYSDDIPKGKDIIYNVSKSRKAPIDDVLKPMKDDPDNPFGASVRQREYLDKKGKEQLSALNIVNEEGDWTTWSRNLSSQVLSKQTPALARKQLGLSLTLKQEEFDEIMSLTNPAVKKALLKPFSDGCDSDSVKLKGAALPGLANNVLLPLKSLKENEVYTGGNYRDGTVVALIRHPHGGIFEIPQLVVNNKNPEGKRLMENAKDAIGINPKVAAILSGADFDGDTVLVIPNNRKDVRRSDPIKALQEFDTKTAYPPYDGMPTIDGGKYNAKTGKVDFDGKLPKATKQNKMGDVSNLITDMTIRGASNDEIARAVKHSMVVIDSEKHHLNYKQSYIDNNIAELKKRYQGRSDAGASTLISRAKADYRVPARKEGILVTDPITGKTKRKYIDPKSGEKLYTETGETYVNKKGKTLPKMDKVERLSVEKDAYKLSSGTTIESIYADHSNALKAMGNKARLELLKTPNTTYSPSAKRTYSKEVDKMMAQLSIAYRNKPLERQAQLLANKIVAAKRKDNPNLSPDQLKKIKGQALDTARARFGAKKTIVEIGDREWEAIQAGAISHNTLMQILDNADINVIRQKATPRYHTSLSPARLSRAKEMLSRGYTRIEIADMLGVSLSTISAIE